jgi:hypothetical protein
MATADTASLPRETSVMIVPPAPKVRSSAPSVLYRASAKSWLEPVPVTPAATIRPSGWMASARASS